MSKQTKQLDLKSLPHQLAQLGESIIRYRVLLFALFLCGVYGFVTFRIYTLSSQPADQTAVKSQIAGLTPHVDEEVAARLLNLKDNSVNVKVLFDKARENPFTE